MTQFAVGVPIAPGSVSPVARYLALLRGINVGGQNTLSMGCLRALVERPGNEEVTTSQAELAGAIRDDPFPADADPKTVHALSLVDDPTPKLQAAVKAANGRVSVRG